MTFHDDFWVLNNFGRGKPKFHQCMVWCLFSELSRNIHVSATMVNLSKNTFAIFDQVDTILFLLVLKMVGIQLSGDN